MCLISASAFMLSSSTLRLTCILLLYDMPPPFSFPSPTIPPYFLCVAEARGATAQNLFFFGITVCVSSSSCMYDMFPPPHVCPLLFRYYCVCLSTYVCEYVIHVCIFSFSLSC